MFGTTLFFRRLLPRRYWRDKHGIGLILWTALSALMLVLGLVLITVVVDLLVTHGELEHRERIALLRAGDIPADFSQAKDLGLLTQAIVFKDLFAWKWLMPLTLSVPYLQSSQGAITACIVIGLIIAVIFGVSQLRARSSAAKTAQQVSSWLRNSVHRQTLRLGPSDFSGQRYQTSLKLFVDEIDNLRDSIEEFRFRWIKMLFLIPILFIAILLIDFRLGLQCLIPAVGCWWIHRYGRTKGASDRQLAEAHAETEIRFLAQGLRQTRLVRGYNIEEFEQKQFDNHFSKLTHERVAGLKLESAALGMAKLIVRIGVGMIVLLIAMRVLSTTQPLLLANAVALGVALVWLFREILSAEKLPRLQSNIEVTGERVYRFLDEVPEVGQAVGAKFIEPVSKSIIWEAVHYRQRGHEILRGVDLKVAANTSTAFVSLDPLLPQALAYLLPRFIEPTRGRLLFDGEDIAWGTLESIRAEVLYVGSDDPSLSGTVLENLICGESRFKMQDAVEAAKIAHVHKLISNLPQGYETVLGEHGEQLEPGDAFRLGLARAILRDPAVLIIDEPKMVLDDDTKALIDDAYQRISAKRTVIYLPGRLSTIRRCDQVVLLHEGRVEGLGTHADLSKSSDLYRHWDYLTFNSFSRRSRLLKSVEQ